MTNSFSADQQEQIMSLFYQRVPDGARRAKILELAAHLGEDDETDRYKAIYHYSLAENWPALDRDYREVVKPFSAYMPESDKLKPRNAKP